jgi:ribose/xylose/arabinose/galactoside ABC-type transport system permease subunit
MKQFYLNFKKSPAFIGFVLFAIMLILNIVIQGPQSFFAVKSIASLFKNNTPLVLITMGQLMLMLVGVIDISLGFQMSLANVLAIMLPIYFPAIPLPLAWFLAFIIVVLVAALNGMIVSFTRIPPLLAGFAMIYIIRGVNVLIMPRPQGSVPPIIYQTYDMRVLGFIPFSVFILLGAFLFWLFLKRTKFLKHVYAVGGNERNAFASGINTKWVKVKVYVVAGCFTGLAGLALTAMTASGNPLMGEPYGLRSISAAIIGGVSLAGGWGTMASAFFGSGFFIIIQNVVFRIFSMIPLYIPGFSATTYWQNLVFDIIVLLGLVITVLSMRHQENRIKNEISKSTSMGGVSDE